MNLKEISKEKRRQLTSQDLKRRLFQKGVNTSSMPSLKSPLAMDRSNLLQVNFGSSKKRPQLSSPKSLKKNSSEKSNKKNSFDNSKFMSKTSTINFHIKKKSNLGRRNENSPNESRIGSKTAANFYRPLQAEFEQNEDVQLFNSSFYKNDSQHKEKQSQMTKRLMEKMSGKSSECNSEHKSVDSVSEPSENEDKIIEETTLDIAAKPEQSQCKDSSLEEYIKLVLKDVSNIDEFLYLVRSANTRDSAEKTEEDNIYQLEIVDYQKIRKSDKEPNFEYYTVSKKGFCHYYNGKPLEFIDLQEWLEEKQIYEKIKKLDFFNRFRRWKTIKMWIKKVVRHRIEKNSQALEEKLFILNPTVRTCILEIKAVNLEMEKGLSIISKNEGTYSLESFKHCQEKTRREAAGIVEQYSRRSRQSVKKCFEESMQTLKQVLKTKGTLEDKQFAATSHNPKDNAFQVLGFPAKMSYEHRSKLRKLTGRFIRFSYLVDILHLNGLANIFKSQINAFSEKLNKSQVESEVSMTLLSESNKQSEDLDRQKMFNINIQFEPTPIEENYILSVPIYPLDFGIKVEDAAQVFNPLYHIREKSESSNKLNEKQSQEGFQSIERAYVPTICEQWLSLKPNLENIFDELSFLIKESMSSLKYFQRWSKHRQMQKYINILEEWDDIVCDSWEISENDNLDPISIIDNLDGSMNKIKDMIHVSEIKLNSAILQQVTEPLNIYWENTKADIDQLITKPNIQNCPETIEFYLAYMTQLIEKFQQKIPQTIELGIFSISLSKMKHHIIDLLKQSLENFKAKLPLFAEEKAVYLNEWLNKKSQRLRQEIRDIDDFVRINKSLKLIDSEFLEKKDFCNDLAHVYQTMYNFKIETKKRKDFEVHTLKAKDQLEQLLINVEQNIERKVEFFTREVSKEHLPKLLKNIEKISKKIKTEEFQSLNSSPDSTIQKIRDIKEQCLELTSEKEKCQQYLSVLKLSEVPVDELTTLETEISSKLLLWENLKQFTEYTAKIDQQTICQMGLCDVKEFVLSKQDIVEQLQVDLEKNQVLTNLKEKVQSYCVNVPLLEGFSDRLTESHWDEINQILKEYPNLDLRKKNFTLHSFLSTGIGKEAKKIQYIFNKARIQSELQSTYSDIESIWQNTLVKSRTESRFQLISNPETLREAFDTMIRMISEILSNEFSQTLKQHSITYDSLMENYNVFEYWMKVQTKIVQIEANCKLLDIKKLPDFNSFESCEKTFKNLMKPFSNRNFENGVKMSKLFVNGIDQKLEEIDEILSRIQDNINNLLEEHRKNFPIFYLLSNEELFKIVTEPGEPEMIEWTAKRLYPCIDHLEFEGQRITGIYNFDGEKMHKSMIPITADIEQIILQISETISDINKKNMRSCRYKTIESALIKLIPFYQTQYLLAIGKVDFSHYTEISIDNQLNVRDELKEFCKVMKKDTTDDLKLRESIKSEHILRYDALIQQSLNHEEILNNLIRKNVLKTTDFEWQSLLRFCWDESNAEENSLTVKQMHSKFKYGNQYIGSKARAIMDTDVQTISSIAYSEKTIYFGSPYNLERTLNFLGYRVVEYMCQPKSNLKEIQRFATANYYLDNVCHFQKIQSLNEKVLGCYLQQNHLQQVKQNLLKKNVFNLKDNDNKTLPVFLSSTAKLQTAEFFGKYRVVNQRLPNLCEVKNMLKVSQVFDHSVGEAILKVFEMAEYLEEKLPSYNVSVEKFIEREVSQNQCLKSKAKILSKLENFLAPYMNSDSMTIIQDNINLLVSSETIRDVQVPLISRKIQKEKNSKRNSSMKKSSTIIPKKEIKPSREEPINSDQQKIKQVKDALQARKMVVLSGQGKSKKHLLNKAFFETHKIIEIFPEIEGQEITAVGVIHYYLQRVENSTLLYLDSSDMSLLREFEYMAFFEAGLIKNLEDRNILIVVASEKLDQIPYGLVSSLYTVEVQLEKQYFEEVGQDWAAENLPQIQHKAFNRFWKETFLSTLDSWGVKSTKDKQARIYQYLTYLKSLLPCMKIFEGMVYCLIRVLSSLNTEYIKLDFLIKKLLGDEKINDDYKVYDLVYAKVNSNNEDLMYVNKLMEISEPFSQKSYFFDYVITPELFHLELFMRRISQKTDAGLFVTGQEKSGKTSLIDIFKHKNYVCQSYLKMHHIECMSDSTFKAKIQQNLDIHCLSSLKAKKSYQKSYIVIEDINMECPNTQDSLSDKIRLIRQLINFKCLQYSESHRSIHTGKKQRNIFNNQMFSVDNLNFVLTGKKQLPELLDCTVPIELRSEQGKINSIFTQYLRDKIEFPEINHLLITNMVNSTIDVCNKISSENTELCGLQLSISKYILSKFNQLRVKEGAPIIKEFEKYWGFLLTEQLEVFDKSKILQGELKALGIQEDTSNVLYSFLHAKDNNYSRKVEVVKDLKKIFNIVNEKIDKYNESENKRYGPSLEFVNFDEIIKKVIKLCNNLHSRDLILCGRRGSGKEALVRLVSYLQGFHFKNVQTQLEACVMEILTNTNFTKMSSYLLSYKVLEAKDVESLTEFYYKDFDAEIVNAKELEKAIKVPIHRQNLQKTTLASTQKNNMTNKGTLNAFAPQYYIAPKPRPNEEDYALYRNAMRVALLVEDRSMIRQIPLSLRQKFTFDEMVEIPVASIQEYNTKLLQVDEVECSPKAAQLMAEIFNFERESLKISLKYSDDCVRLFSSFMSTLFEEIKEQLYKYGRVIDLFGHMKRVASDLEVEVAQSHKTIQELIEKMMKSDSEQLRTQKQVTETELHEKSDSLAKTEKIVEMLNMLIPFFQKKYSLIQRYVLDKDYFEECIAVAACYFTYLSELPYQQRRSIFKNWFGNPEISLLVQKQPIDSFLALFNLYSEEFNAEPIDDLEDFYENMAIVFNSVKPVIVRDKCKKGKAWLEKVCSFVTVSENESNFVEVICENLAKPSNILIEITNQGTLNDINNSFINTLLFLSESTETINIKGQEVSVSPEAKFYVLMSEDLELPMEIKQDFTVVCFHESQQLLQKNVSQSYMTALHPDSLFGQLELKKKMRNLKLEQQALMLEIGENIYTPFETETGENSASKDQGKKELETSRLDEMSTCDLVKIIANITDKVMTRGQNLANKLKEKEDIYKEISNKHNGAQGFEKQTQSFCSAAYHTIQMFNHFNAKQSSSSQRNQINYPRISYHEYFQKIQIGLRKGFITENIKSLLIFALKVWGNQYTSNDYLILFLELLKLTENIPTEEMRTHVEGLISPSILSKTQIKTDRQTKNETLSKVLPENLSSITEVKQAITNYFVEVFSTFEEQKVLVYLQSQGSTSRIYEGDEKKIILNCIWSTSSNSRQVLDKKLDQSGKSLLQLKELGSVQSELKKSLFEDNIISIEDPIILGKSLNYLKKVGSSEKIIYFCCHNQTKKIQKAKQLAMKYGVVFQLYHQDYENSNLLFKCLQCISKVKESQRPISSQSIKSSSKENEGCSDELNVVRSSVKKKSFLECFQPRPSEQLIQSKNAKFLETLKTIVESIISHINDEACFKTLNIDHLFISEKEVDSLVRYLSNAAQNEDLEFSFQERLQLTMKCLAIILGSDIGSVNRTVKKILRNIQQVILSESGKQSVNEEELVDRLKVYIEQLKQAESETSKVVLEERVKRIKFESELLWDLSEYYGLYSRNSIQSLVTEIDSVVESTANTETNINAHRTSRKSLNAIFRKDSIHQKLNQNQPQVNQTKIKRVSKNVNVSAFGNKSPKVEQEAVTHSNEVNRTDELYLQIEIVKARSRFQILKGLIEKMNSRLTELTKAGIEAECKKTDDLLRTVLLVELRQCPGLWNIAISNLDFTQDLVSLTKRLIKREEELRYTLDKFTKMKSSCEVDIQYLTYPLRFLQSNFRKTMEASLYGQSECYMISNCPSEEELSQTSNYLKLAGLRAAGWKFSSEGGFIELHSESSNNPKATEKGLTLEGNRQAETISLYLMKKESIPVLNVIPIDVFENKNSQRPLFRVYGQCRKNSSANNHSISNANSQALRIYLREAFNRESFELQHKVEI